MLAASVFGEACAAMAAAPAAMAQERPAPARAFDFDLPAQPLARSVAMVANIAGLQAIFSDGEPSRIQARPLSGRMTAEEALARLTAGTGYAFRYSSPGVVTLRPAPRAVTDEGRMLGPVRIEGATADSYGGAPSRGEGAAQLGGVRGGQDQEARGLRPVVAAIGAGAPTALEDIPRSVSVLTQDQMVKQDVQDIGDAIRRLPGLTLTERLPSSDTSAVGSSIGQEAKVFSRGFEIQTVQVDGGAPQSLFLINNGLMDLTSYERVELIRGPNGTFAGATSPGGSLNLVRKRPGSASSFGFDARVGQFERYQIGADYSTPSLFGSPFAFRTVLTYQDQQFAWDRSRRKNGTLYAIVDSPLGDAARLELGGTYSTVHEDAMYEASYRYADGPNLDLPFTFNISPDWTYVESKGLNLFGRYFYTFGERMNFDVGFSYGRTDSSGQSFSSNGLVNLLSTTKAARIQCRNGVCTPVRTSFLAPRSSINSETIGADARFTAELSTWIADHDLFVGLDISEARTLDRLSKSRDGSAGWPVVLTLEQLRQVPQFFRPDFIEVRHYGRQPETTSSNFGVTITDVVSWRDRVFLNLSARYQDLETSSAGLVVNQTTGTPTTVSIAEEFAGTSGSGNGQWRPGWSLSAKPLKDLTVYGSYSEGFQDQGGLYTLAGERLGPSIWENQEMGVKFGPRDWLLSVSGYRLMRSNVARSIAGTRGLCLPLPTSSCYELDGDTIRSTGLDVQLSGEIVEGLSVEASYNYNESRTISTRKPLETRAPYGMAKLFVEWRPDLLPKTSLRAGASYRGRIYEAGERREYDPITGAVISSVPYEFEEPAHVIYDLGLTHRLSDTAELDLWIENVADKQYYSTVSSWRNFIGQPRTANLSIRWRPGGWTSGPAVSPTTGLTPFGEARDWYAAFGVGPMAHGDWTATSEGAVGGDHVTWTFESESRPLANVKLGYWLNPSWRVELEGGYRHADITAIGGSATVPRGLCGVVGGGSGLDVFSTCKPPSGEIDAWDFMLNAYHDFGAPDARLKPFVGLGLGATRDSLDFAGRMDGYTDQVYRDYYRQAQGTAFTGVATGEKLFGGSAQWGLSVQAMAGLSYQLSERMVFDLTYRHMREAEREARTVNVQNYNAVNNTSVIVDVLLPGAGLPPLGTFKGGSRDNRAFTVGFRYAFGDRR